jgi:bromodomain and WD repeat domain-containing protein 1/3
MNCSSFSSGGLFMAAGSADNHVRVYHMLATDGPERILEVEHHGDRVDSISWANQGLRFVSGSNDGTALIWRFENACWRYIRLNCSKNLGYTNCFKKIIFYNVFIMIRFVSWNSEAQNIHENLKRRPKVTMVAWNRDDSLVLTAVADFMIRVWNSKTGELVRVLKEHNGECFVIEPHPVNPRIVCTAGHDGKIIIWDIGTTDKKDNGSKIYQYYNQLGEGQGHGAIFDCKWAPDGFSIAATDSHGHLMFFSIEKDNNLKFKKLPKELFFHSDYRPLSRDAITDEIVDEQTQTLPHLMPPPFLVDVDGNPYTPELQRMVPGRENMKEEYLVPNVAVSDRGIQEVIEGIPTPIFPIPVVPVVPILAANARSNIDERIQELAREQGLAGQGANRE